MTTAEDLFELGIYAYSRARSLHYVAQFALLNSVSALAFRKSHSYGQLDRKTTLAIAASALELFKKDSQNIQRGIYPLAVLKPEWPFEHLKRLPRIIRDGISIARRRERDAIDEFTEPAQEFLNELPRYYRRNFHYQTDGYLSEKSAELYEHQVEMLFGGAADAMRRLILGPLRKKFGYGDGTGLTFLEIGAGTGRSTRFVRLAYPKAKIIAVDLSEPYLKVARNRLSDFRRIDFVQGDGAHLPFQNGYFDAVYSVFLFHELPLGARRGILSESHRVLKPGGFFGFVDSLQLHDGSFQELLSHFPDSYHEPFFKDYIARSMEELISQSGFKGSSTDMGFFSKVCWAEKNSE